jgi:hypothetical protein
MTTALVITTEVTEFLVKDTAREVSDSLTELETAAMKRSQHSTPFSTYQSTY